MHSTRMGPREREREVEREREDGERSLRRERECEEEHIGRLCEQIRRPNECMEGEGDNRKPWLFVSPRPR